MFLSPRSKSPSSLFNRKSVPNGLHQGYLNTLYSTYASWCAFKLLKSFYNKLEIVYPHGLPIKFQVAIGCWSSTPTSSCSMESEDSNFLLQSPSWFSRFLNRPTFPIVFFIKVFINVSCFSSFPKLLRDATIWMTSCGYVTLRDFSVTHFINLFTYILGILHSFLFTINSALGVPSSSKNTKWLLWMNGETLATLTKSKPNIPMELPIDPCCQTTPLLSMVLN